MATPGYEERDGVLYLRCHYCNGLIPQEKLGQHIRAHAAPDKWFSSLKTRSSKAKRQQKKGRRRKASGKARRKGKEQRKRKSRRLRIRELCKTRKIVRLVHFTRIESLERILQEGLLPRSMLEKGASGKRAFIPVDPKRYDRHTHTISVSISFPNYQMFYKYRAKIGNQYWVVLSLDPALLWELDCAFCMDNAASAVIRKRRLSMLKRPEALHRMFAKSVPTKNGRIHRSDLAIPDQYPTNPQAEVLVCEPIAPHYIFEVAFHNHSQRRRWIRRHGEDSGSVNLVINRGFFRARPGNWERFSGGKD